ncbi:hypothetical protein OEZ86_001265 [Tetradesmus obliquus]|nr:hypothetical protein OEZ86_001265 [Tetradesmus obliquus]
MQQERQQQQRRGYGRWRSAVLAHLGSATSRMPIDQLLGCVVALAQHHAQEAQQDSSSSSSSSSSSGGHADSDSFLQECIRVIDAALERHVEALEEEDQAEAAAASFNSSISISNRARLGDYAFAVYQGISQLQGGQLAALVAALAALQVPLAEPLGPRSLDGKAKVTYGMVLAAAASAAARPATLAATAPDAVAQLAAGVAALGGRPDGGWWAALQQRLAGQLGAVSGARLQQLLGALGACGVRPGQEWLQEAGQATLAAYDSNSGSDAASLQELRQQSCSASVRLIACSSLLVQLGAAALPQGLQEALVAAVDAQLLQPFADGAASAASPLQPAAAASLLADAGCALADGGCTELPEGWLARYAAVAGALLPAASGDGCCRLAAAVAGIGCTLSSAWLRELTRQLDAKVASAGSSSICAALAGLGQLSARPSTLMANTLLAQTLPPASRSPSLPQQLLQLFVRELSQQDAQLHPHIAAQLFCPAVAMTVTLTPAVATGSERPDQQLGGCLVQCLADVEADWQAVWPLELTALPRMAANVQLELAEPQAFVDAVLLRLQELAKLAKASQAEAAEAVAAGRGPGHLLQAAVLLVMNKQHAEPGNSTWQGLADHVVDASSSSAVGAEQQQQAVIPLAAFDAADEAATVLGSSMSAGELCDMLHCFFMADQIQRPAPWLVPALEKLSRQSEAAALSANQQQALLVVMSALAVKPEQQTPAMLQAVLSASGSRLERWPAAMLPFTLQTLGSLALRWAGQLPEPLEPLLLAWQAAAVAALQPRLHLLPAASYVQMLLGCSRLKLGLQQQLQQEVSGLLDELGPDDCVLLLAAYGAVAGVGPALGQELMARLQPQLGELSIDQLVDALNAFAKCPQQARPEMTPAWLDAFLQATGSHMQQAAQISASDSAAATTGGSGVLPHHLLQLALGVPHLPALPPRAWQSQLVLAAAALSRDFSAQQAAEMLIALARWKQSLAAHMAPGSSSAESAAAAHASFASCLPLYDSLMLVASRAGGIAPPSVGTANGGLSVRVVQALPEALRQLQWPADEAVVQAVLGYLAAFRQMTAQAAGKIQGALLTGEKQLQQLHDDPSGAGSSTKKQRKGSSRGKQPGGSSKQELLQLQEEVDRLHQATEQAAAMVQGLDATADDWQQLLSPSAADGLGADAAAAAAAAGVAAASTGGGPGFGRGDEDRLLGGLDVDALMAGMMQAAGMPQPPAAAAAAAGAPAAFYSGSGADVDVDVDVSSELDELLGGLAMMSELQGAGWELLADDEGEEGGGAGEEYIDTVAEDVV